MHACLNVGYQGKSGPGKIRDVILVISQVSVLLTYIKGRQMVAPKLLNIQFERQRVPFQLLVRDKVWKQNWVSMQQHSRCKSYGILSMCQFTNVIYIFFYLVFELINYDLLSLCKGAVVR